MGGGGAGCVISASAHINRNPTVQMTCCLNSLHMTANGSAGWLQKQLRFLVVQPTSTHLMQHGELD